MRDNDRYEAERQAAKYARWLAQRDGITIDQTCRGDAIWGNHERIQAVKFQTKTGELIIELPNWDWNPEAA